MTLATQIRTVALAGNPNSGKTTIFNALTGLRQKTGNYPGVTVEKRSGTVKVESYELIVDRKEQSPSSLSTPNYQLSTITIIDLPGTYSLISGAPDEKVAVDVLTGRITGTDKPDAVIVVVDASNLQRNLYLVSQLIEMQIPMVIALNMMDIAERRGIRVSAEILQAKLGVPVVPVVGHRSRGIDHLKRAIANAAVPIEPEWPLPEVFKRAIVELEVEAKPLSGNAGLSSTALAERLLVGEPVSIKIPDPFLARVAKKREELILAGIDPMQADVEAHYIWIDSLATAVTSPVVDVRVRGKATHGTGLRHVNSSSNQHVPEARATANALDYARKPALTDRADRILLHKVWGLLSFTLIMTGIFISIFFLAAPLMDYVESGIGALGGLVSDLLPDGTLKDMWNDGIVAGVGGVLVFIPQIAILFGLLAILEDSGYLARAAFLMDRLLGKVGLSGKAFVPLLSGFACAIPGVMAARTIAHPMDRLRTIFVLPFMSCSARLPVYALLIGAFFASSAWYVQGGIMLGLYLTGIVAAFATAWIWKSRGKEAVSSFIMELPSYKVPQWSTVLRVMWTNTWAFVSRAGTIIFALSIILWAMTYWPRLPEAQSTVIVERVHNGLGLNEADPLLADPSLQKRAMNIGDIVVLHGMRPSADRFFEDATKAKAHYVEVEEELAEEEIASAQLRHSLAGRFGHLIEPVIRPMGFDWKMGVGLVGAFAAREVFVSTMGIVYAAGDAEEDDTPLREAMMSDTRPDGTKIWTPLVAIVMLIWFVLAMQCLSTVAIVKRETGGWKWPLLQLAYMNGLAYVICVAVFQIGRFFGA
jgi:ferrous iron transport protein B